MMKLKKENLTQRVDIKEGFLEEVIPKLSWVLRISKGQPSEEGMEGRQEHSIRGNNRDAEASGSHEGKARNQKDWRLVQVGREEGMGRCEVGQVRREHILKGFARTTTIANTQWELTCARHTVKHITCVISLNPPHQSWTKVLSLFSCYWWGMLSHSPEDTHKVSLEVPRKHVTNALKHSLNLLWYFLISPSGS